MTTETTRLKIPVGSTGRRLLSQQQVADRFVCSTRKLERHRVAGDGPPYVKLGALVRYPEDELDAWIKSRTRLSTSAPEKAA
jgi:predicted DNA-binding transcriptional regulator AlpA